MRLPVYKMNFPRKNPMKMAAMTTRREGREAALVSRARREVEFDVMWSERGAFLIRIPSSCEPPRADMKEALTAEEIKHIHKEKLSPPLCRKLTSVTVNSHCPH